jgi:hypothetical protein
MDNSDQNKARVYVVQENRHADYSDAERFGEVVFMTVDEFKPLNASLRNEDIKADIRKYLGSFTRDDFIILTGNPTMIGFAFHLCAAAGVVNVLQWDKIDNSYKPFQFQF